MSADPAALPPASEEEKAEGRMPFMEHLNELRVCLVRAAIGYAIGCVIAGVFSEEIFVLLLKPLLEAAQKADIKISLNFASPVEPFWVYFKVAMIFGLFLAAPVIFWQLWRFVGPGLYRREKRFVMPFTFFSAAFFIGGAFFCQKIVMPIAYQFFLGYSKKQLGAWTTLFGHRINFQYAPAVDINPMLMMEPVLSFALKMLIAFGLVFELPLVLAFLASIGVVSARALWRFNKFAIIICFIVGGVLTPGPDVMSQCLMSIPLFLLYNMSIVIAWLVGRGKKSEQDIGEGGQKT